MALAINKDNIFNIAIIILAIIFAFNIHKAQEKALQSLKEKRNIEFKKNEVLGDIKQLEKTMNSYKKFFNKDSSQVINTLNNIARDSSVKIISIKPQTEIILPTYTKYPFDLSINVDSYHILGRFISKIESHSDVYIVEKTDIKSVGQILRADQEYKLDVNLRISAISLKD